MKKTNISRGVQVLPSLCTAGSMFFGFASIIKSIGHDFNQAAWAIFIAGFFDLIDGRVARMAKAESDFGKEFDSLIDLSSFGLAPAILMYQWTLYSYKEIGFFLAFVYFSCVALRLARFNVQSGKVEKGKFQGLPSPPAAGVIITYVLFYQNQFRDFGMVKQPLVLAMMPTLAFLLVSSIRYSSFKELNVNKSNFFIFLVGATVVVGSIAINPNIGLFICACTYALSGPFLGLASLLFRQKKQLK
ncbi:MAG: CDP-diacylglycerol--serine O-phosphatidyltransferase [Deltaproteobacteria bacterium]|nr:MAG: CDP-diacylglycerol--serine O-phosphatidyltransferase [Deltaproteobacteria bacterium]